MTDHFYLFQTQVDNIYKFGMTSRMLKLRIKEYTGLNKPKSEILNFVCNNCYVMEDAFKIFLQTNKIRINKNLGKEFFTFDTNIKDLFDNFCNIKDSIIKTIDVKKIQSKHNFRRTKCNKCKCWRKKQDFIRRDKTWSSCNICAEFNKKYQQNKVTKNTMTLRKKKCNKCKCWRNHNDFIRREKEWKQCNKCADFNEKYRKINVKTDTKTDHQSEIKLMDLE